MDLPPLKLPIHDHPLMLKVRFTTGRCRGCNVNSYMYGGYFCNEPCCGAFFHKECGEAQLTINHCFHPQHPLLLTKESIACPCDLCGQKLLPPYYCCSTCQFKVDLTCGMKPSPPTIEHPMCHNHPLVFLKKREEEEKVPCEFCKVFIDGPSYSCLECSVYFHVECVPLSKEFNHPCHSTHPLKLIAYDTLTDDAEKSCRICARRSDVVVYHCSICNFTICVQCTKIPPPLVFEHTKTHKHPLTRFSRRISFLCDVCGEFGSLRPYICLQCDFVVHMECIGFPRVTIINRHDHRIFFTHHLGVGYSKCGVCRKTINQYTGAYSCSVCPNYAVHSRCMGSAWDGVDYEGIPEITEDIAPYKVVGDNLIRHFSHEKHPLKLRKGDIIHDVHKRCEACIHPLGFGSIYICEECSFSLHEKCANLPMKKRIIFDFVPYRFLESVCKLDYCTFCGLLSDGFKYTLQRWREMDVHCGSLFEPFIHDGHIHPLYFYKNQGYNNCNGCRRDVNGHVLHCDACDFYLCFSCASLPEKIWYSNDGHPLTLCYGEKAINNYWCDICEKELDSSKWFYTCFDCGVTLHSECLLGDFSRLTPGKIHYVDDYEENQIEIEVVLNNHNTRPLCSQCHFRCNATVILKGRNKDNEYICSNSCFSRYVPFNIYVNSRSYLFSKN